MSLIAIVIALIAVVILAGAVFVYFGLRGRRVGDHPFCVSCNHDLFGRPDQNQPCPECGANLSGNYRVAVGRYERRRRPLAVGLSLLLAGLLVTSLLGWASISRVNLLAYAPSRVLTWLATGPIPGEQVPATNALATRMAGGALTQTEIDSLADKLLAIQADPTAAWDGEWGDLLVACHTTGKLSADRWVRYARQIPNYQLICRSTIRHGDNLPLSLMMSDCKGGTVWLPMHAFFGDISVTGPVADKITGGGGCGLVANGRVSVGLYLMNGPLLEALSPGTYNIHFEVPVRVTALASFAPMPPPPPIVTVTRGFDLPIRVLPATQPSVVPVRNPELRNAMQEAVFVDQVNEEPPAIPNSATFEITADQNPVGISYFIFVAANGHEQKIGSIAGPQNARQNWAFIAHFPDGVPKNLDVIFRADPAPAINSTNVYEYWDEPITVKDLPIPYYDFKRSLGYSGPH